MTSIRKFAYAALLAVTWLNFAPSPASAQEPAHGKFNLTRDVLWENIKVPAGEYEFSFDPNTIPTVLNLHKLSGARAGFILLVSASEETKRSDANRLLLANSVAGSYVSAMQLPEFSTTLLFKAPRLLEKKFAKTGTSVAASGQ